MITNWQELTGTKLEDPRVCCSLCGVDYDKIEARPFMILEELSTDIYPKGKSYCASCYIKMCQILDSSYKAICISLRAKYGDNKPERSAAMQAMDLLSNPRRDGYSCPKD